MLPWLVAWLDIDKLIGLSTDEMIDGSKLQGNRLLICYTLSTAQVGSCESWRHTVGRICWWPSGVQCNCDKLQNRKKEHSEQMHESHTPTPSFTLDAGPKVEAHNMRGKGHFHAIASYPSPSATRTHLSSRTLSCGLPFPSSFLWDIR